MLFIQTKENTFTSDDELVEIYQVSDGSWRVAYYPYADKDRNLTLDEAYEMAKVRHKEASSIFNWQPND